jgi:hypothetical protein
VAHELSLHKSGLVSGCVGVEFETRLGNDSALLHVERDCVTGGAHLGRVARWLALMFVCGIVQN